LNTKSTKRDSFQKVFYQKAKDKKIIKTMNVPSKVKVMLLNLLNSEKYMTTSSLVERNKELFEGWSDHGLLLFKIYFLENEVGRDRLSISNDLRELCDRKIKEMGQVNDNNS